MTPIKPTGTWDRPRDPARIPVVLEAIRAAWERNPDLRLMQILVNALGDEAGLYAVEDGEVVSALFEGRR